MTALWNIDTILLIVAIFLVIIMFILTIVQNFRRKPTIIDRTAIILLIVGLLFLTLLVFRGHELGVADWAQTLLMIGLVLVTAFYASSAEKQAHASVKMAEEMRTQRYSESLPLLVPVITPDVDTRGLDPTEIPYWILRDGTGLRVTWRNLGKGVAINSRFSFWSVPMDDYPGKVLFLLPRELEAIGIGEQKQISFHERRDGKWYDILQKHHPRLEAEYQDTYKRKVTTVQKFRIEEHNDIKRAFIGELYFTINGRRLGEEDEKND